MTDLHAAIGAALDREQARSYACDGFEEYARTLRRIAADRRVLARHSPPLGWACDWCALWPDCPELLDLAARVDVQP